MCGVVWEGSLTLVWDVEVGGGGCDPHYTRRCPPWEGFKAPYGRITDWDISTRQSELAETEMRNEMLSDLWQVVCHLSGETELPLCNSGTTCSRIKLTKHWAPWRDLSLSLSLLTWTVRWHKCPARLHWSPARGASGRSWRSRWRPCWGDRRRLTGQTDDTRHSRHVTIVKTNVLRPLSPQCQSSPGRSPHTVVGTIILLSKYSSLTSGPAGL